MNIVLLGMPGSGKGTQSELLIKRFKMKHISTGDIFRKILQENNHPMRSEINKYISTGQLVPDKIVIEILKSYLGDDLKNLLFDGFPRNLFQAVKLDEYFEEKNGNIDYVIFLELSEEEVIKRLTARRICPSCKRIYTLKNPEQDMMICNECGINLQQRVDDTFDIIKRRLQIYKEETLPLVDYYKRKKKFHSVNAEGSIENVFNSILKVIK